MRPPVRRSLGFPVRLSMRPLVHSSVWVTGRSVGWLAGRALGRSVSWPFGRSLLLHELGRLTLRSLMDTIFNNDIGSDNS